MAGAGRDDALRPREAGATSRLRDESRRAAVDSRPVSALAAGTLGDVFARYLVRDRAFADTPAQAPAPDLPGVLTDEEDCFGRLFVATDGCRPRGATGRR